MGGEVSKEEEEERVVPGPSGGGGSIPSSPSASHDDHHDSILPPLPPPLPPIPLHLYSLPDIGHDAIASYLTMRDMHGTMESSPWLMETYGERVKEVKLLYAMRKGRVHPTPLLLSTMSRRPNITGITTTDLMMSVLGVAMRRGYLNKVQALEIQSKNPDLDPPLGNVAVLCDALADGLCPKISKVVVPNFDELLHSLGGALRSRIEKGCSGLKSLEIKGRALSLSALLSSGACDALEELRLHDLLNSKARKDLSKWLLRTNAAHLRVLTIPKTSNSMATAALCSPGVAPRLQVLHLSLHADEDGSSPLSEAIIGGAWPELRELGIEMEEGAGPAVPSVVEAIGIGGGELVSLEFHGIFRPGSILLARMLADGECPRLEELDLSRSGLRDVSVVELARALEGGAPCNTTLRRLDLSSCSIDPEGIIELARSMERGALPHLECLNLSGNNTGLRDVRALAVAGALAGGALRSLRELNLWDIAMEGFGAKPLFQAFRDHNPCPHLKKLSIGGNHFENDALVELAEAIKAGALQNLQELNLSKVGMGNKGFKAVIKAIVAQHPNPGCPRLENLNLCDNKWVRGSRIVYLAEVMKSERVMQHLQGIDLCFTGVDEAGLKALVDALQDSHVCPALRDILIQADDRLRALVTRLNKSLQANRGQGRTLLRMSRH